MFHKILMTALFLALLTLPATAQTDSVTLWGVFFNNPGACSDGVCGEDDIFVDPVPPRTAVVFLSGQRVPANGVASFGGGFGEGSTLGALPLPVTTLEDAQHAEIHLVVRTHGDFLPGIADDQITSFGGGCDVQECGDIQFAIFRPEDADANGRQTTVVRRFSDGAAVTGAWATLIREADGIRAALHTDIEQNPLQGR